MRAHFTPQAEIDLEEVGDHIALDNPLRAVSFIGAIRQHCEKIADGPHHYVARPDLGDAMRICAIHLKELVFGTEELYQEEGHRRPLRQCQQSDASPIRRTQARRVAAVLQSPRPGCHSGYDGQFSPIRCGSAKRESGDSCQGSKARRRKSAALTQAIVDRWRHSPNPEVALAQSMRAFHPCWRR